MKCASCGQENTEGRKFCRYCGKPLAGGAVASANAEAAGGAVNASGATGMTPAVSGTSSGAAAPVPTPAPMTNAAVAAPAPAPVAAPKKAKTGLVIGIVAAAVVLLVGALLLYGMVFSGSARTRREIQKQQQLAERYLDDLDYERAIAAYQAVLEIDPANEEALRGLEDSYTAWAEAEPEQAERLYREAAAYLDNIYTESGERSVSRAAERLQELEQSAAAQSGSSAAERESVASNTATADRESGAEESAASGALHLTIYSASLDDVLSDASVSVRGDDGYEEELHGSVIDLDGLAAGSYRVSASADGHNAREAEFTIDAGEELTRTLALAPEIVSADDACVLLVWDGEQDLDLCGFNADIQEYVNCGHIKDSVESMILFGDHGADKGFELLYVHDISYEVVKSIYVTEASPARTGGSSAMERDGVHVYLYDKDGERFSLTADASRDAALWRPFYIYAGEVYPEEEYISDTSGLAWLSFDEADQIVEQDDAAGETASAGSTVSGGTSSTGNTAWKQAYLDFINNDLNDFGLQLLDRWDYVWDFTDFTGCLIYVDNDAVPELYYCIDAGGYGASKRLLTYHGGTLEQIGDSSDVGFNHADGLESYIPYSSLLLWGGMNGSVGSGVYDILYRVSGSGFREVKSGYWMSEPSDAGLYCEWAWGGEAGYATNYAGEPFYGAYHELIQRDYDLSRAVDMENYSSAGWMSYDELISYLSR